MWLLEVIVGGFLLYAIISCFVDMLFRKKGKRYGQYPCVDYLNNALRYLLKDENPNVKAINEIFFCITKANGEIYDDVLQGLDEMQKRNIVADNVTKAQ